MRYLNVLSLVCLLLLSTVSLADQNYVVHDEGTVQVSLSRQALNYLLIQGEKIIGFQGSMEKHSISKYDATLRVDSYGGMYLNFLNQPGSFFVHTDRGHHILVIPHVIEGHDQLIILRILP